MSKVCEICGKGTIAGRSIKRRGMAKKKGGVGKKITGITKRTFKPNLKNVKTKIKGTVKHVTICAKCLKAEKVVKI
ncbi:MAG: 50S ribosomal protein L28 [Candidatus Omnitrophota bacterium]